MTLLKNIGFTNTITTMIMEPAHANSQGSIHGGELMKIMDNTAGIVGLKHCKGNVVTARVDELVFKRPVDVGDIITCTGQLTYVGNTSMQIMVKIYVRNRDDYDKPVTALSAFFTMVHLQDGKPSPVPQIKPETKEEGELYKLGEKKYMEIRSKF